jgi:hypothetical protein
MERSRGLPRLGRCTSWTLGVGSQEMACLETRGLNCR